MLLATQTVTTLISGYHEFNSIVEIPCLRQQNGISADCEALSRRIPNSEGGGSCRSTSNNGKVIELLITS